MIGLIGFFHLIKRQTSMDSLIKDLDMIRNMPEMHVKVITIHNIEANE